MGETGFGRARFNILQEVFCQQTWNLLNIGKRNFNIQQKANRIFSRAMLRKGGFFPSDCKNRPLGAEVLAVHTDDLWLKWSHPSPVSLHVPQIFISNPTCLCLIFMCLAAGTAHPTRKGFLLSEGTFHAAGKCGNTHRGLLTPVPFGLAGHPETLGGLEQKPGFPQGLTAAHGEWRYVFVYKL